MDDPPLASPTDAAFARFYETELDAQVRRCYLLTGSNEAANDIVQDAMVEVYQRWPRLDRPGAYLNRAVLNRCRDRARHGAVVDRSAPLLAATEMALGDIAEQVAIDNVLGQLPFRQRAALVLRYYGGLTTDEIADALGCRPGSVGPWISRGLASLRKELS